MPQSTLSDPGKQSLALIETAEQLTVQSGIARLVITKKPWSMTLFDARNNRQVTSSPFKALGLMERRDEGLFSRERLTLAVGEQVYGLGERFAALTRNGQTVDMMSGFGYWSHDIGGFESKASSAVYKRWVAFGLMSSHSRLRGSTSYRVPWLYDEEAIEVVRFFTQLKCRLMPYLMQVAVEAHETNVPMMRAMLLEYPEDPTCRTLDRQYGLGPALLVGPVFHGQNVEYCLPEGKYINLLSGDVREGKSWYQDPLGFMELPLYLKPNQVLPMSTELERVDYDYAKDVRLVFGLLDETTSLVSQLYDREGKPTTRYDVTQAPGLLRIQSDFPQTGFEVQLPWLSTVQSASNTTIATATTRTMQGDPGGVVVKVTGSVTEIRY